MCYNSEPSEKSPSMGSRSYNQYLQSILQMHDTIVDICAYGDIDALCDTKALLYVPNDALHIVLYLVRPIAIRLATIESIHSMCNMIQATIDHTMIYINMHLKYKVLRFVSSDSTPFLETNKGFFYSSIDPIDISIQA